MGRTITKSITDFYGGITDVTISLILGEDDGGDSTETTLSIETETFSNGMCNVSVEDNKLRFEIYGTLERNALSEILTDILTMLKSEPR